MILCSMQCIVLSCVLLLYLVMPPGAPLAVGVTNYPCPSCARRDGCRYVRIISGLAAFWFCEEWKLFFWCYWLSYFLDCFDGAAARKFNQATRFGQMLDMVRRSASLPSSAWSPPF